MPQSLDALLTRLEAAKSRFGPGAAAETKELLHQLSAHTFSDPRSLLRFHEVLLFLRAFPQASSLIPQIERLLNTFHLRVEKLRDRGADMSVFDDFDTSGLSGTAMQDTLNFEIVRWLVRRIPRNVEIAWGDYWDEDYAERAMGSTWLRFVPLLEEDSDVEATIPWRRWLDAARGREWDLAWLIHRFEELRVSGRQRAELFDSLRLPIRWRLGNLKLSRTRNWSRPRAFYFHSRPLITRNQVSLAEEFSKPAPRFTRLPRREGERIMHLIREVMLVRYRELYGTTLGDPRSVVRADLGRGVIMHLWNLPPSRRLPLRAYVAGFTLKNGVPINYIEAIGLCEWIEVGFNTFYTYRQGETAWIYAQALRCLRALTGATTISVYPYQIGLNNDEAIDSGAFWFYRKLGFRCGRRDLEQLARREEQKIAANPQYRTPRRTLKRLAEAHVFYDPERARLERPAGSVSEAAERVRVLGGAALQRCDPRLPFDAALAAEGNPNAPTAVEERPFQVCPELSRRGRVKGRLGEGGFSPGGAPGPWDTFSTRNLALRVNRRMAREFHGDATRIRQASAKDVCRALDINPAPWTPAQRRSLENWSLVLALIPSLANWSRQEKRDLIQIIQSQSAANEMRYLCLTQRHPRLRQELLRLGS
jgi:hypothetical protein